MITHARRTDERRPLRATPHIASVSPLGGIRIRSVATAASTDAAAMTQNTSPRPVARPAEVDEQPVDDPPAASPTPNASAKYVANAVSRSGRGVTSASSAWSCGLSTNENALSSDDPDPQPQDVVAGEDEQRRSTPAPAR